MLSTITPQPQLGCFRRRAAARPRLAAVGVGRTEAAYGWSVERVALAEGDQIVAGAQLLFRALPFRLGTMAYLPMGGYVTAADQWSPLWDAVDRCAKRHRAAFLKWEPGIYRDRSAAGFRPLRLSTERRRRSSRRAPS